MGWSVVYKAGYDPVFAFYIEMGGARALVQVPLDRWRFSRHFGI